MKKMFLLLIAILTVTSVFSQSLPSWITNTKVKGDFRFREDYSSTTGENERYRTRIRFRLGITTEVNEKVILGFNLATGSSNPRTTNVTLADSESKKSFNLDSAYIVYKYSSNLHLWAGKYLSINHALFLATDLLWDTDITPEGVGAKFKSELSQNNTLFVNSSVIILDEFQASGADPFLYFIQPGISVEAGKWTVTGALTYYKTVHAKGNSFEFASGTNSLENGVLKYEFSVCEFSFQANRSMQCPYVAYFKMFGNYLKNSDADDNDTGYSFGFGLGKKIKKLNDFSLTVLYRYLEKDAWIDILPDADSFGGKTGVKGVEFIANYGLAKNVYLTLDYYNMKMIDDQSKNRVLQFDINFKF